MSEFQEYEQYDALGLAQLVKQGQVSPVELCTEAIRRIERLNPQLNAVVHPMYEQARALTQTKLPESPFSGVPFLIKDLIEHYAGVPMTSGCRAYRNFIPNQDSETVRRYKQAGLIILGKTNLPEFGLVGFTEPELFGACHNPWNLERTPGGSSGGSAAAVASGMVPMASGGDGGGSLRIPASCCGLFGLKPTRGRVPNYPDLGSLWQGATVKHVLTRSVRDSAAMLDLLQGIDPGAPYNISAPELSYLEEITRSPGALRIAFNVTSPVGKDVHPECLQAVEKAARLLESLGHHVETARPEVNGPALAVSYITMVCAEVAADLKLIEQTYGSKAAREEVELATRTLGLLGKAISSEEFVSALREWDRAGRAMATFFKTYDLYLTPTMARPPIKIGELAFKPVERTLSSLFNTLGAGKLLKATGIVDKVAIDNLAAMPFTQLANLTGLPAMSVPLHWSADQLPIGVQFIAPFGMENVLFRLAAQLEIASPWFNRRPPIS